MKRILILLFSLLVFLVSCDKSDNSDFFDYQEKELSCTASLSYNGNENTVLFTLVPAKGDASRQIELEYLSPETVSGYRIIKEGNEYVGIMGDVKIPFGSEGYGVMGLLEEAFSLSEDMINSIAATDKRRTVAGFTHESYSGSVTLNSDGSLYSIDIRDLNGNNLSLTIE